MKYRKKPVVIEAEQFDGCGVPAFCANDPYVQFHECEPESDSFLSIDTLEGTMHAQPGDFIIRGIKGELYPCKPDIFAATYEEVPPADNETPQPAPCGSAEPHEAHHKCGDGWDKPTCLDCPGIAAPVAQQSAGTRPFREGDFITDAMGARYIIVDGTTPTMSRSFAEEKRVEYGLHALPNYRELWIGAEERIVALMAERETRQGSEPETKSLDADHPALSAVQADLGDGTTRPDEGAGPSESVRHAARRDSRDAGLDLDADAAFAAFMRGHRFDEEYGGTRVDYRAAFDAGLRAALASQRSEEKPNG